jgi:hypothetical protein
MILTVGIMIISGALGGMVSALCARDDQQFLKLVVKHTLIGAVSALTVPLVLSLMSSNLLESGQTRPLKLLTVGAMCVLFGMFSPRLIERTYRSRSENGERQTQAGREEANRQEKKTERAVRIAGEGTPPDRSKAFESQSRILRTLADAEDAKLILADLLRATERSQKDFDDTLSLLMAKGAVAQELSAGRPQLVLTTRGRQQLNKMSVD